MVSLNKTSRQNSLFAVLQYSESFLVCKWSGKRHIIFINYKISVKLMFCVIFVNVLVWRRFGVPLIPICAPLFSIRVPLVPICVTLSISSPLQTYFAFTHPTPFQDIFVKSP